MIRRPRIVFVTVFMTVMAACVLNVVATLDFTNRGSSITPFRSVWEARIGNQTFGPSAVHATDKKRWEIWLSKQRAIESAKERGGLNEGGQFPADDSMVILYRHA